MHVDPTVRLYVSVQVETARERLPPGPDQGIAADLADFRFAEALGLSSYPYLAGFAEPEDVPLDYYSRVAQGSGLAPMVVEGGWTSASVGGVTSSPLEQARWIRRQIQLLDEARALFVFQLTFTDLDLVGIVLPPGSILPLFAALGLGGYQPRRQTRAGTMGCRIRPGRALRPGPAGTRVDDLRDPSHQLRRNRGR